MQIKKNTPLITTDKIEELKAFYCDHFGFKPVFDKGDFLCLASSDKNCEISFMKPTCEDTKPHHGMNITFCFEVKDVDSEHDRLISRGVQFVQPPKDNPWGDRSAIAVDPIGIGVYIYKMIQPTEEYTKYFKE
jgi:uncharacterized glyoxalase superfamily protein PhnB